MNNNPDTFSLARLLETYENPAGSVSVIRPNPPAPANAIVTTMVSPGSTVALSNDRVALALCCAATEVTDTMPTRATITTASAMVILAVAL